MSTEEGSMFMITELFHQFANIEQYAKVDILTAVSLKIRVSYGM